MGKLSVPASKTNNNEFFASKLPSAPRAKSAQTQVLDEAGQHRPPQTPFRGRFELEGPKEGKGKHRINKALFNHVTIALPEERKIARRSIVQGSGSCRGSCLRT